MKFEEPKAEFIMYNEEDIIADSTAGGGVEACKKDATSNACLTNGVFMMDNLSGDVK